MSDLMEMPEGFEDPSYGGGKFENWSLKKDSSALYRILPAMKSLKRRKDYGDFWYTHFYKGLDPKNPTKFRAHPILCIQEKDWRNGGVITKRCPLCEKRNEKMNRKKAIEAKGASMKKTKAEIAKACNAENLWLKDHGHDGKWRLYATDKTGAVGVLKLNNRCMKDGVRVKAKKLVADGHTPMGVKGIFFEFTRHGDGFQTPDEVQPHRLEREDGSSVLDFHVFTPELARLALDVLPDFDDEKERIRYSEEVLEALAACSDDPAEVNLILGIGTEASASEPADNGPVTDVGGDEFGDAVTEAIGADLKAAVTETETEEDDEEAELAAALAAAKAKKAAKAAEAARLAAPKASAPKAETEAPAKAKTKTEPAAEFDPTTGTDEDFDGLFGAGAEA